MPGNLVEHSYNRKNWHNSVFGKYSIVEKLCKKYTVMMKRIILIVFGVSFCFHLWGQQGENYCQKLVNNVSSI